MGNHPQENLAKYDYRLEMKIGKFKNPFTFWLFVENCCKFWQIYKKNSKSIELGSFFSKKILCMCWHHIFQGEKMQKFMLPKNIGWGAHYEWQ
jgi:hypothetical protein